MASADVSYAFHGLELGLWNDQLHPK